MTAATARMSRLIDDLLKLARFSRAELRKERFDIVQLARESITELFESAGRPNVELQLPDNEVEVWADRGLIGAALENLLDNALKFSSRMDRPRVEFLIDTEGQRRTFTVADNGAGFDMAHASSLFMPFQRLHSSGEFPGTGIGLATVRRVIQRHGGSIQAWSTPGAGARFTFTLGEETDIAEQNHLAG